MLEIITRSIASLFSKKILKYFIFSLLLTFLLISLFVGGISWLFYNIDFVQNSDFRNILNGVATFAIFTLAILILPFFIPLIANVFLDNIAEVIETDEYNLVSASPSPLFSEIMEALKFIILAITLNILVIPLYIISFGALFPFIYYPLNSYLLGREFFETYARRHLENRQAKFLRKKYRISVLLVGGIIIFITHIPFLNLSSPFLAIILSTHLFLDKEKMGEYRG